MEGGEVGQRQCSADYGPRQFFKLYSLNYEDTLNIFSLVFFKKRGVTRSNMYFGKFSPRIVKRV